MNSHLGSLSGPSEEEYIAQGSSLVDISAAVAFAPSNVTANATVNSNATATTNTTSDKAAQLSVAKVGDFQLNIAD